MSYDALHEKKSLSVWFMAIEKSCMAIPVCTSKSDALSATTMRKLKYRKKPIPVTSHTMGYLRETYGTILQRDLSYSDEEIRIFY